MVVGITPQEQQIIEEILDAYADTYAFYYYGSRVKGNFCKTSDLDVLIKGNAPMPLSILTELKGKFDQSHLPYIVNFSDYHNLTPEFYKLIEKDIVGYKKIGNV
ncbi:MAG: nucleotidyltransferase domain-containing protein [Alphaproteobacteria bacterium]|nr:nucleotidyltransferase domain-containing protein [Alphaproteobacteria bacterium]